MFNLQWFNVDSLYKFVQGRFPYVCTKIGNFDCRCWLQSIQSTFLAMFVKHISNLDSSNFFSSGFWCFTFSSFDGNSDVFFLNDFGATSNISLCNQSSMLLERMDEGWVKISSLENYIIIISIFYIISFNRRSRCHPSLICKKIYLARDK